VLPTLREIFGHAQLRAGQEPVIRTLLEGRSALAVFPTGGGKSLCYQLPALMLDGLTLVISPLIALMKDQVDSLRARGVAADRLDSTLDGPQLREVYERIENGSTKLLYIAPERLANEEFRRRIKTIKIALAAVDEAHCIAEWGHNFRPDYLKLPKVFRQLKVPRVLALTATATPKVSREIRRSFRIAVADEVRLSFHRPNLDLRVTPCAISERKALLAERLRLVDGPAVVYVTRQETAEEIATFLNREGFAARAYHAGLPDDFRADAQAAFMQGHTRIMVATIAFGMGIDKADIRAVFHYNLPKSLENHTQEIGRAGRDGLPAHCELLLCAEDLTVLENFIYSDTPTPRALGNLLDRVLRLGDRFDISPYDLSVSCDIRPAVIETVMTYLEIGGWIEATGSFKANYRIRLRRPLPAVLAGRPPAEQKFLARLLEAGEEKRSWTWFTPSDLAATLASTRERIVAALISLGEAGDGEVTSSGVRLAFRKRREVTDLPALAHSLTEKFLTREQADLDRLKRVIGLAAHRNCLTGYLTAHFGEVLAQPCGHCDRCRGIPGKAVKRPRPRKATDAELSTVRELIAERHAALTSPRQLARFLCGMSSPASTAARLTRHDAFGLLSGMPFAEVLTIAEA
jgi:ATP-dependent DNA helicase RecQ